MKLKIVLPLPPKQLHPNARTHYMSKARKAAEARHDAALAGMKAMRDAGNPEPFTKATALLRYYFKRGRRRDNDNMLAWAKSYFDGLADAGVIVNDSGFTHLPVWSLRDDADPRLEIEIECLTS